MIIKLYNNPKKEMKIKENLKYLSEKNYKIMGSKNRV